MFDAVRKYVEAGREALTPRRAEDLARTLVREGQARRDQVSRVAGDLLQWSRKNSERLRETIRGEVKRQIARSGVATKDDLEPLKRRIRALESSRSTTRRSSSPKSPPKSTRASASRKATSRQSTSRKSTSGKRTSFGG
jgi:polyhydroxyalkanoate synthesis regulator phasin